MTPLEKALTRSREINYCDECEHIRLVNSVAYCGQTGKLLHPLMYERGEGSGPARRCRHREGLPK